MAEFKTAEQYVVEKVEFLEKELEDLKIKHSVEISQYEVALDAVKDARDGAQGLLNRLRDFMEVRRDDFFGNCIHFDTVYGTENAELVALIMEYFDMYPSEDENDEH
jgi:hypothetical protein